MSAHEGKAPKENERAPDGESPESQKRAEVPESSELDERANVTESPEEVERDLAPWEEGSGGDVNVAGNDRPVSMLRMLADCYQQTQKLRIQTGNRLAAIQRGVDAPMEGYLPEAMQRLSVRLQEAEKECGAAMDAAIVGHPAMAWLGQVAGIGPVLAAKMLAMIDIRQADTVSALWRFAGYAVVDGKRERPVKGERLHYCVRLKTTLYLAGGSFLKLGARSPYRAIYDKSREYYNANRMGEPHNWTKAHCHQAALRYMIKLFLSHLWVTWRTAEGLDVRAPYVLDPAHAPAVGLHSHYLDPWSFVRPKKAA